MADDALRLQAEVVDRFSAPLKNLQTQLRGISAGPAVKQLKKDLEEVQGHMAKTATVVKDLLNPALAGLGIATLSIGGALAGAGAAMRGFSADTTGLSYLSREVGISAGKLRELQSVAGRFNLDPGSINKSTRYFADQLDQMHRNRGEAYNYLLQQGAKDPTGNVSRWTQAIKTAKTNAEAYQRTLEMIASVKDPQQRGDLAEKLLGDRSLGQLGSEGLAGLHKQQEQARKDLGDLGKGSEDAAISFERAIQSMRDQIRGLRDDLGPDLMQPLNDGLREFGGWLREHKGEIKDNLVAGIKDLRDFFRDTNWKEIVGNLTTVLHAVETAAHATADAIRGIVQAGQDFRASTDRLGITSTTRERRIAEIDKDIGTLQENRKHAHDGIFGKVLGDRAEKSIDANIAALQAEKQRLVEERNTEEVKKNTEELKRRREREDRDGDKAKVDPSAFDGTAPGDAARILKASFGGGFGAPRFYGAPGVPGGYGGPQVYGGPGGGSPGGGSPGGYGGVSRGNPLRQRGGGLTGSPSSPEAPVGDKGMLDLIARAEGTTARGYNDSFAHQLSGDLSSKTLGEIEQIQRGMRGSSAIGRYQFMRGTLFGRGGRGGLVQELGLDRSEKFTPELQDRLANRLIERRYQAALRDQQKHGGDLMRHFRTELAREWASFPGDYGQAGINGGMYPGQRASISRERLTASAQRWLDQREGRLARQETKRDVLADPNDERRKPLDELRQIKPWTKAEPRPAEKRADLMGRARAAGLVGSVAKAEGHVQVHVNAPKGWSTKTANKGSLFREVKLNRGNAMQLASQEA